MRPFFVAASLAFQPVKHRTTFRSEGIRLRSHGKAGAPVMKTTAITPREMQRHIARFSELTPSKNELAGRENVPVEAYEYVAATTIFTLDSMVTCD
jgi:hypothetical protein